jgi:GNAT superfamily N-acetyltransferase
MLAAVVTYLEMRAPPPPPAQPAKSPFRLSLWQKPDPQAYRALFRRVGAPWLWFSRLVISDGALAATIHDPQVQVHAVTSRSGAELGLVELDFRQPGECELAFFGLIPEMTGRGHGKWLMEHAISLAWKQDIGRFWVHTCTLDHPAALDFYRAQGFQPYARAVETFADPRLAGILPEDIRPDLPLIRQT